MTSTGWALWGYTCTPSANCNPTSCISVPVRSLWAACAVNLLPWRLRRCAGGARARRAAVHVDHLSRSPFPYLFPKAGPLRHQAVLALARHSGANVVTNPADWVRLGRGLTGKLHPIPIGSNIQCEPPPGYERDRQRARWGADRDTWLLGYFGFLNAGKGGETLIRCLAELVRAGRPARLLMVGGKVGASDPTNLAYLAKVEALIAELGLAERVQWTGFTDPPEVSANLLAADCAVLPYREGASLRHGSLMAAGSTACHREHRSPGRRAPTPASSRCRSTARALLLPPDDPAALAAQSPA